MDKTEIKVATLAPHKLEIANRVVASLPVKLISTFSREPRISANSREAAQAKLFTSTGDPRISIDTMKQLDIGGPSVGKMNGNTRYVMEWFTGKGIVTNETTTLALIGDTRYETTDFITYRLKSPGAFDRENHWSSNVSGGIMAERLYMNGDLDIISASFKSEQELLDGFIGVSGEAMRKIAVIALRS